MVIVLSDGVNTFRIRERLKSFLLTYHGGKKTLEMKGKKLVDHVNRLNRGSLIGIELKD